MYHCVIFDLDGTLSDPFEGISHCVCHALSELNIDKPSEKILRDFIGPPLQDSFRNWFGLDDEGLGKAVDAYRDLYEKEGIWENTLYPGIAQMLADLKEAGVVLAVASSKPEVYVRQLLEKFEIEGYFTVVAGSSMDKGKDNTKVEVLSRAVEELRGHLGRKADNIQMLMVGDRKFDIEAAHELSLKACAVSFGYGEEAELTACDPEYIVDDPEELVCLVTGVKPYQTMPPKPAFLKTFDVLLPLLLFWAIELGIYNLCYAIVLYSGKVPAESLERVKVYLNVVAAVATWPYLARCYRHDSKAPVSDLAAERLRGKLFKEWPLILGYSLAFSLGLNIVLTVLGMTRRSVSFQSVATSQYSVSLSVGLVIYGILIPFTEELLFRGIVQRRIARYFPEPMVIPLSALIFGCYHGNPVQILYAFLMGLALALVYQYYDHIAAPVIMHCGANLLIYFITKKVGFGISPKAAVPGAILVCLAIAVSYVYVKRLISKRKRRGF
ncbi:MAG: HAD hydrolase-like protein [Lachnospiraceae bacterium]|nr:HAD hydrolase-like protein [Lachnospiraceae bacterium]